MAVASKRLEVTTVEKYVGCKRNCAEVYEWFDNDNR
jgi:hypothetical protein